MREVEVVHVLVLVVMYRKGKDVQALYLPIVPILVFILVSRIVYSYTGSLPLSIGIGIGIAAAFVLIRRLVHLLVDRFGKI